MDATATKDRLHLRIEQADEKLLNVLAELTESLFRSYQPGIVKEVGIENEETDEIAPPSWAKPMTKEESLAELREANAAAERGEVITIEELEDGTKAW